MDDSDLIIRIYAWKNHNFLFRIEMEEISSIFLFCQSKHKRITFNYILIFMYVCHNGSKRVYPSTESKRKEISQQKKCAIRFSFDYFSMYEDEEWEYYLIKF